MCCVHVRLLLKSVRLVPAVIGKCWQYLEIEWIMKIFRKAYSFNLILSLVSSLPPSSYPIDIYSCYLQLPFSTDEEAAASKRMVIYAFSAQINLFTSFFSRQTTFAQHSFHLVSL